MANEPITPGQFYEALGLAIAQWSKVEDAFCDVFIRLTICSLTGGGLGLGKDKQPVEGEGHFILGNIFYATTNFRGQLEILTHMVKRLVRDQALLAEWNAIKNRANPLYQRRNVMAHGSAWADGHNDPAFVRYSIFSTRRSEISYPRICAATASFARFAERVGLFAIDANASLAARKSDG